MAIWRAKNGVNTVILRQLLREGAMSKALDYIKAALQIAFGLVVLAIILLNFRGLHLAVQKFLERAAQVSAVKVLGVEIDMGAADRALSAADAKRAVFHVQNLTDAEKRRVLALIHGLDGKEFVRLMYVGQLKNLCEFENPSTEMRDDAALDYELRDRGLTKIEVSPATLESVRAELAKTVAQGKSLDNGYPRTCYDMTLTDDGYNVKTVLVKSLGATFDEGRKPSP
ncbi:MAG: hypothetical protein CR217_02215 [Beijerinckiaceae bacterium]|nr:MAG: hypothetical protein CR217_02215 [Beijerinckiaceae bacterium]